MAPGEGEATVKRMSEMWTVPRSLGLPIWMTGLGLDGSEKWGPVPGFIGVIQ